MKTLIPTLLFLCLSPAGLFAQEHERDKEAAASARAALDREIRDRIIWYSPERTSPLLIPEDVIGLVPYEELPVPEDVRQGIRMWISYLKDGRTPAGQPFPECRYPRRVENDPVRPEKQTTVEEAVANGPVSLVVTIEKTTRGYWPIEGIYQYNEFTPLKLLVGKDFPYQDPLSARAFMSEGGEVVVDGTRLCSLSPWHKTPPRRGDTYLLIGAPDDRGIFYPNYYFRIENENIVFATYSSLKEPSGPLALEKIESGLVKLGKFNEKAAKDILCCTGGPDP